MQAQIMILHQTDVHCPKSTFQQNMQMVQTYRHSIEKCHQIMYISELGQPGYSNLEIIVVISKIAGMKGCFTIILMLALSFSASIVIKTKKSKMKRLRIGN